MLQELGVVALSHFVYLEVYVDDVWALLITVIATFSILPGVESQFFLFGGEVQVVTTLLIDDKEMAKFICFFLEQIFDLRENS